MRIPKMIPLGRLKANFVKVYDDRCMLAAGPTQAPVVFIDLELPQPEYQQQKETEIHIGISANFQLGSRKDSGVKPHIDIYLPLSEIGKLEEIIGSLRSSDLTGEKTRGFENGCKGICEKDRGNRKRIDGRRVVHAE